MERSRIAYAPGDATEAAAFLRACSERREAGVDLRAGLLESPFTRETPRSALDLPTVESPEEVRGLEGPAAILAGHARLGGVREVSRGDLLAVCGGGATIDELRRAAAAEGLFFAHEPAAASGDLTVAELVMAGLPSPTDGRFGALRESILSVELVTPSGEVVRTGSRSVKDVAGYEIPGLLCGAGGVCGMISSVTVRLRPEPGTRLRLVLRGEETALDAAGRRIAHAMRPLSIVVYPGAAGEIAAAALGLPAAPGALLAAELLSPAADDETGLRDAFLAAAGVVEAETVGGDAWRRLAAVPRLAAERAGTRGTALWTIHDGAVAAPDPPDAISWRSTWPDLRFAVAPLPGESNEPADGEMLRAIPGLERLLAGRSGAGRRFAVGLLRAGDGDAGTRLVHPSSILEVAVEMPGAGEYVERARIESVLWTRIRRVFDPAGIMLP